MFAHYYIRFLKLPQRLWDLDKRKAKKWSLGRQWRGTHLDKNCQNLNNICYSKKPWSNKVNKNGNNLLNFQGKFITCKFTFFEIFLIWYKNQRTFSSMHLKIYNIFIINLQWIFIFEFFKKTVLKLFFRIIWIFEQREKVNHPS